MDRTELAFFPIVIDHNFVGRQSDAFADSFRVWPKHHPAYSNRGMRGHTKQMF
jgi:hypothetical protein